jgi:predicted porin
MQIRKTQVALAVGAALSIGSLAVQAQVAPSQQGVTVQLYGQMSRALMWADDGAHSKWFHVDGQPSSTRIGINASGQIAPGLRAGGRIETEMKSNPSDVVSFETPSIGAVSGNVLWAERWLEGYIEGGFGRITLGQGSGAADDVSTIDLSGTNMPNGTCPTDWGGGIVTRNASGAASGLGTVGGFLGNCNDFQSRYDRVRYDSPTFGGFQARVSHGQASATGEATEASIWYTGKLAGDFQAAIGWSDMNNAGAAGAPHRETIGFGVGWLHTSGFNVAANWTQVEGISGSAADSREGTTTWVKVGYKFGQHAVALDYGIYEDIAAQGDEGDSIGIGYVWNPVRWAEFYSGYHLFSFDRSGVSAEDVTVFTIGTRIRF